MSYILEALRKAERERNLGQVPALRISAAPTYSASRRLLPWWMVAAAAVAVLGVGMLWWWRTQPEAETATLAAAPATPQPPASAAAPAPPVTEPPTQRIEVQTPTGPVEMEIPAPPPAEISEQPLAPDSAPQAAPIEEEAIAVEDLPAIEQVPEEAPVEAAAPIEEIGPGTPELPPEEPLVQDLPSYNGLPENIRSGIAQLNMNAHVYSSMPGRGFVMINGKKYRQGDQLAEGPEVIQILPDSVVLRYRGTDFLLPVPR